MARVKLWRDEIDDDRLPRVCARCGRRSAAEVEKTFSWAPPWVALTLLAGLIPYVIVAVVLTKKMWVPVPVCSAHRGHWRNRSIFLVTTFVGLMALAGVAVALIAPPGKDYSLSEYLGVAAAVGLVAWVVAVAVLQTTAIRPVQIIRGSITLTGVAPAFVDAVRDERDEEYEAEPEYDRRRSRRRDSEDD